MKATNKISKININAIFYKKNRMLLKKLLEAQEM